MEVHVVFAKTTLFLFIFSSNVPISPCFTVAWALVPKRGVLPDLKVMKWWKDPSIIQVWYLKFFTMLMKLLIVLIDKGKPQIGENTSPFFSFLFLISLWFLTLLRKKAPQRGTVSNVQYALSLLSRHSEPSSIYS